MTMIMMMVIPTYVLNSHCCHYEQKASKLVSVKLNKLSAVLGIAFSLRSVLKVALLCVSKYHKHNTSCLFKSELHHTSQNLNKHQKPNVFKVATLHVLLTVSDLCTQA